ncbi:hypothetical protein DFR52_1011311, partial [Hoeflea marina]
LWSEAREMPQAVGDESHARIFGVGGAARTMPFSPLVAGCAGRVIRFDCLVVAASGQEIPIEDWRVAARLRLG